MGDFSNNSQITSLGIFGSIHCMVLWWRMVNHRRDELNKGIKQICDDSYSVEQLQLTESLMPKNVDGCFIPVPWNVIEHNHKLRK